MQRRYALVEDFVTQFTILLILLMGGETNPKTGVELPGKSSQLVMIMLKLKALYLYFTLGGRTFGLHRASSSSCLIPLDLDQQQFVIVGGFDAGAAVGFVDR